MASNKGKEKATPSSFVSHIFTPPGGRKTYSKIPCLDPLSLSPPPAAPPLPNHPHPRLRKQKRKKRRANPEDSQASLRRISTQSEPNPEETTPLLITTTASKLSPTSRARRYTTYGYSAEYDKLGLYGSTTATKPRASRIPTHQRTVRPRSLSLPGALNAFLDKGHGINSDDEVPPVFLTNTHNTFGGRISRDGDGLYGNLTRKPSLSAENLTSSSTQGQWKRWRVMSADAPTLRDSGQQNQITNVWEARHRRETTHGYSSSSDSSSSASSLMSILSSSDDEKNGYLLGNNHTVSSDEESELKGADWLKRRSIAAPEHTLADATILEREVTPPSANEAPSGLTAAIVVESPSDEEPEERESCLNFEALEEEFMSSDAAYLKSSALEYVGPTWPYASSRVHEYDELSPPQCVFYSTCVGVVRARRFQDFAGDDGRWLRNRAQEGTFWIDVNSPSSDEMELITKVFGIHPLTVEDIGDGEKGITDIQREKCEVYPHYTSLTVRTLNTYNTISRSGYNSPYPSISTIATLWILVYPSCILTFHTDPLPYIPDAIRKLSRIYDVAARRVASGHTGTTGFWGSGWVCYLLIENILTNLQPLVRHLEVETEQIEDLVLCTDTWADDEEERDYSGTDMLRRIHSARKRNTVLMKVLVDKVGVLKSLAKKKRPVGGNHLGATGGEGELGLYFGGLQDRTISLLQTLRHFDDTLTSSHSEYLSTLSLALTSASKRSNDVMRKMTGVVTLLVPLGVLTGVMGMNVRIPGQEQQDLTYFIFYSTLMGCLVVWGYKVTKKWGWFGE